MELSNEEFRIAKGWRIFVYTIFSLMFILYISIVIIPVLKSDSISEVLYGILILITLMMIVGFRYILLLTFRTKFVIKEDCIQYHGYRTVREFALNEIKGFEKEQDKIIIQLNDNQVKPIEISKYFERYKVIEVWCENNLINLIQKLIAEEYNSIIENEEFGEDKSARENAFRRSKKIAAVLNVGSFILAAWLIFYPIPYEISMWCNIVAIPIVILAIHSQKGLIKYDKQKDGAYPDAAIAVFASPFAICLRSLLDNDILDYSNVWWPFVGMSTILIFLILALGSKPLHESTSKWVMYLGVILATSALSLGVILFTNCFYDYSAPKQFQTKILEKRISHGKHTSHYLLLSNWGREDDHSERDVSENFYDSVHEGDSIEVDVHRGKWNIPWVVLSH